MSIAEPVSTRELSTAYVREIFRNLESGDGKGFFNHVTDDVLRWGITTLKCSSSRS